MGNNTVATTKVDTKTKNGIDLNYDYIIDAPLFIKFAEFLGYVGTNLNWCDDLCDGKDIDEYKKKFIEIEAKVMFDDMVKDIGRDSIKEYFEAYYEVILYVWDDNLQELKQKSKK